MSCCKVPVIVWHTGIMTTDGGSKIRCCKIALVLEHATGDVVRELFDLFSNVFEEGVAGPQANHHD